jgi:hypothetical protein
MKAALPTSRSGFFSPATYQIGVQGRIPAQWFDRLKDMTVTEGASGAEPPVTTLLGELADQATLIGVLKTLHELRLVVLLVERVS